MRSCNKPYTITEYGGFARGSAFSDYQGLPERTFDALEEFILANNTRGETGANELLSLSIRRGAGKIITARNYVGLITMTDGTVIEILPKIAGGHISEGETRRIFLEMLKTVKDVKFKNFNVSSLKTERMSLFEIFIKMFLDEISALAKQGLKSAYMPVETNERFYKGKLLTSQDIKHNLVNRERFFVRYDEFSMNRPENRLIKSTLKVLLKVAADSNNLQNAIRLLTFFDGVEYSENVDSDFSKCFIDRSTSHYDKALSWCRIFLRGNSFTPFSGSEIALALLFPMERVFESFVAAKFRKHTVVGDTLRVQDTRYSLFDKPTRAFALHPDLVLESGENTIVLDTKWKLLSGNEKNSGISQSDMYQMYAYGKKYRANKVVLIYPRSEEMYKTDIRYVSNDQVQVAVNFIDLKEADDSVFRLMANIRRLFIARKKEGTHMLGAIIGDIVGSRFEFNNHRSKEFDLFGRGCFATDDSIMSLAIAKAIMEAFKAKPISGENYDKEFHVLLSRLTVKYMQEIGRKYPGCGYGGMFYYWVFSETPEPYDSFGNGSAMRVSPAGFAAASLQEAKDLAKTVTEVTHNHKEGIKGAEATAVAIYLARNGASMEEIREHVVREYYPLDFKIDDIRSSYQFNETCQKTVPEAIECFLESTSFEDAIRTAISLGGDSDTIAAITGAIAEAYYGVPDEIKEEALTYLDEELRAIYDEWEAFCCG
jgi:5-methylcytosine-specific restriction enzyme subunit McrC